MKSLRLLLLISSFCLAVPMPGQTFGEITGEVRDPSGAAVPNALITVTNKGTNAIRTATSNEAGVYSLPSLLPGIYDVKAVKNGFRAITRVDIEPQVQQTARIDFNMQIGQVTEQVEVLGGAPLLATENATVGTVVENKRIVELPLNGRNYLQLASLSPNVSYGFSGAGIADQRQGGSRAQQNISVAGQRSAFNHFTLDGVENTDVNFNTYVI